VIKSGLMVLTAQMKSGQLTLKAGGLEELACEFFLLFFQLSQQSSFGCMLAPAQQVGVFPA